jgi:hypothetical protein
MSGAPRRTSSRFTALPHLRDAQSCIQEVEIMALAGREIAAGQIVRLIYDGTNFQT